MTTKKEKALRNRKKIMDTAIDLFNKYGFDNVSVRQIIEESDSSKGAFYGHFKSKSYIYIEKFNEIDGFYLELADKLSYMNDSSKKIAEFTKHQMEYLRDVLGIDILNTIYRYELEIEESVLLNQDRPNIKILKNYVLEGQQSGLFSKDFIAEEITSLLMKSLRGTIYEWCATRGEKSLERETEKVVSMILKLITVKSMDH